ncbi:MAG TPA: DUF4328 domain-containing protein [Hyphomonadaceae bacterium]|jgi:hypothetical protein|nr:DUF4328 domain-containing protein [Hyphomonadaceae bacterium]
MTDIAAGAAAPDDLFATTSTSASQFSWSAEAKSISGNWLKFSFYLFMLAHAVNILILVVMLWTFQILEQGGGIEDPTFALVITSLGSFAQLLPAIMIGTFVFCTILYLMFVYRAAKNLELSKARGISISPGAAVGWSFAPFINFVTIYNVMKEIWVASQDPGKGTRPATIRLILWWGLYLAGNVMARGSDAMVPVDAGEDATAYLDLYLPGSAVGMLASLTSIVSTVILHTIITDIVRAQNLLRSTSVFED